MPGTPRIAAVVLLLATSGSLCGCAWMRNHWGPRDPFAVNAPCVFPPDADATVVVDYLNANTARIPAWRSDRVVIRGRGDADAGMPINALMAIEAPRNFRLVAKSPIGSEEVDLGSNPDQFWYWIRRSERKHVFVAYHDEESIAGQQVPIPFEPDWIMEALGVTPIDASESTVEPGPTPQTLQLISYRPSPEGGQVRKVTVVDTCRGIVSEHALYDSQDRLIARARLSGHIRDRNTQAVLPTRIDLDWPKARIGLTMELSQIQVKPQNMPGSLWQVPEKKGYPVYDLNR